MMRQKGVSFSLEQYALWEELKRAGKTSKSFAQFVKDAFHERIDLLRLRNDN